MHFKSFAAAAAALSLAASASAMSTLTTTEYTLVYDETTPFGSLSSWFSSGSTLGFTWKVPVSASIGSIGANASTDTAAPTFTLTPNTGWSIGGPFTAQIGNLVYTEVGGATASASGTAAISVNGGPATALGGALAQTTTATGAGFTSGYFSGSSTVPLGAISSLSVSSANLHLAVSGVPFSSITVQPQNTLTFSFTAAPVPEPETYALMLAGLGAIVVLSRRRWR